MEKNNAIRFAVVFVFLFLVFYYFNIFFFRETNPGPHYNAFLADHFNYIKGLRWLLLSSTSLLLKCFGFSSVYNNNELLVAGHGTIQVVYTCLGLGMLSFFTAFVIAYPKPTKIKIVTLAGGIIAIELLNIIRFALLALYGSGPINRLIDHHTLFNIILYLIVAAGLYFWIKRDITVNNKYEAN